MTDDLEPITPTEAVELHLETVQSKNAAWTEQTHRSNLRPFIEWCREEGGIDSLDELSGRDLFEYRIWRRDGNYSNGRVDTLAPSTLDGELSTIRSFLRFAASIEAVHGDFHEKVPLLNLSGDDEVSDSFIRPDRVPDILEYLERYEYASRDHVAWTLFWHTGMRVSAARALDLRDLDLDGSSPLVDIVHRPPATPLKNDKKSERVNRITKHTAIVLEDYVDGPRIDLVDDHGREPVLTTEHGRVKSGTLRDAVYRWSRPCFVGKECPHGFDPDDCEYTYFAKRTQCPSARSPHDIRKARVTAYRNENVPRGVVSDRLDASEDVLDKHYDRASKREKANRRWRLINQ